MSLISLQFGVFFLGLLIIYYIMPLKIRWSVLLIGSAAFYLLTATPYTVVYLVFSITTVYFASKYIEKDKETAKHRKAVYIITVRFLRLGLFIVRTGEGNSLILMVN